MKKTTLNISALGMLAFLAVSICFTSCKKEDLSKFETPTSVIDSEFLDEEDMNLPEVNVVPILHKSFDASLSKEEIDEQWEKAIQEYDRNSGFERTTTVVRFEITTTTANQSGAGTNGRVRSRVWFNTNGTNYRTSIFDLEHPDVAIPRQRNSVDMMLFRLEELPVRRCVGLRRAQVWLRGTDGWFLSRLDVRMRTRDQDPSASGGPVAGFSSIFTGPGVLLDNNTTTGWDTFNTFNIGTGQICWN